jgi:hypothetical protein
MRIVDDVDDDVAAALEDELHTRKVVEHAATCPTCFAKMQRAEQLAAEVARHAGLGW